MNHQRNYELMNDLENQYTLNQINERNERIYNRMCYCGVACIILILLVFAIYIIKVIERLSSPNFIYFLNYFYNFIL